MLKKLNKMIETLNKIHKRLLRSVGHTEAELEKTNNWARPEENNRVTIMCGDEVMLPAVDYHNATCGIVAQIMFAKLQELTIELNMLGVPTQLLVQPPSGTNKRKYPVYTIISVHGHQRGKPAFTPMSKAGTLQMPYAEAFSWLRNTRSLALQAQAHRNTIH